jgi:hypothetical protein
MAMIDARDMNGMQTEQRHCRPRIAATALLAAAALLIAGCKRSADSSASSAATRAAAGGNQTTAGATPSVSASPVDQQYAAILSAVVGDEGLVRYAALAQEPLKGQLDAVVAGYAAEKLPSESDRAARMALWCNAYNADMLKIALEESRKEGFTTIKEVPGVFDQRQITVAGEAMTLDGLKDRLRAMKDPRIHAALVFGARGCPPLRNEPYAADRLNEQLDRQSFAFLDDFARNGFSRDALLLSSIFQWHAEDFAVEPYGGPAGFIKKHGRPNGSLRGFLRRDPQTRIDYLEFNWLLNDAGEN